MARHHSFQIDDPADVNGQVQLDVHFTIENPGREPEGYGEHYDPGCGPEFTIVRVQDGLGHPVELTAAQIEAAELEIIRGFNFFAAARAE